MEACSKAVFVRDKSSANMDKFLENLQNVNLLFSSFVNKYMEICDNCFPYKKIPPLGNGPVTVIYRVTAVHRFPLNSPGSQLITLLCANNHSIYILLTITSNSNAINRI